MDYRLPNENEQADCNGECQDCDQETWMRCHEIEVHGPQYEEAYYDSSYSFR